MGRFLNGLHTIHRYFGCEVGFQAYLQYRSGELCFEFFVSAYVDCIARRLRISESGCTVRSVLKCIVYLSELKTRISLRCQLLYYDWLFRYRGLPQTLIIYSKPFLDICFEQHISDNRLIVNLIQRILKGRLSRDLSLVFDGDQRCNPGCSLLKERINQKVYYRNEYFIRAATEERALFDGYRLEHYFQHFLITSRYPTYEIEESASQYGRGWNIELEIPYLLPDGVRDVVLSAYRSVPNILPYFRWNYTEQELALNDKPNHEILSDNLQNTTKRQYLFRTVCEPYVSIHEIIELAEKNGIVCQETVLRGCEYLQILYPEVITDVFQPRSLQHLCRCSIRQSLHNAWQHPDVVYTLKLPKHLQNYLYLKEP